VASLLLPKRLFPVPANMPGDGAEDVVAVVWPWGVLFWAPNSPLPPELAPPPNMLDAGLLAVAADPPNRPPPGAGVVVSVLAPPNSPPLAGAEVAGVVEGAVAARVAPPKSEPPDAGVVDALPPNNPVEGVAVPEGVLEDGAAPKRLPAGFGVLPPLACPNKEPALPEGVAGLAPEAPPRFPKENEGVVLPDAAAPKMPPEAGAVVVALFDGAPDELGVPKVYDMIASKGGWCSWRSSVGEPFRGTVCRLLGRQHVQAKGRKGRTLEKAAIALC